MSKAFCRNNFSEQLIEALIAANLRVSARLVERFAKH